MKNVVAWLESLGLAQYAESFVRQRVGLDLLPELTDGDLERLGVAALGDRKRILKAITALPDEDVAAHGDLRRRDAERRQLTVMFCDLVGSTDMATALDPEDLRVVTEDYHDAVAAAVGAHAGYVAQLLGDGVLVYFGYPQANEDDAASAIRAALDVIAAVGRLTTVVQRRLQTRIGIATGLVVVGEIGAGTPAAELSASGETPNLASRLQSQAAPDRIVISDQTRKLIGNVFELEPLGPLELKGFQTPILAWQVLGERHAESRFEARHSRQLSRFVGRDSEVSLLLERWSTAGDSEGQTVLLSGEPGIGKSRIMQTFRERVSTGAIESILLQCSPHHRNSALQPLVRALEIAAQLTSIQSPAERETQLARYLTDHGVSLDRMSFGCLLKLMAPSDEAQPVATDQTPQQQKQTTLQALVEIVLGFSRRAPVLLMIEDAHWIDPTTEEWVGKAIDQLRDARVLILITARPEYVPSWGSPLNLTRLTVNRLSQRQAAALIESVADGKPLPSDSVDEIIRKTDGVPLFIEEVTKTVLEFDLLPIPSTLQDSLMARLDRLGKAKEVAQVAAAIGRNFSREVLAEVMHLPTPMLDYALDELLRAEIAFRRGTPSDAGYAFKHALIRDIAYNSIVRSQRALLHGEIARALERTAPTLSATQPELLAHHHQEAGNDREAIRYWIAAGDLAWRRSAGREATIHYACAIALIARLPADASRTELELSLHLKRGHALSVTEGYGSQATYQCYERARRLAKELGRVEDFVSAWSSSAPTLFGAGKAGEAIDAMREIGPSQLASLEPDLRAAAMINLGVAHFLRAEIDDAWGYLEAARLLDDAVTLTHEHPVGGGDPAIVLRAYVTRIKALQGHLDQAEMLTGQSMQIAESRAHTPSIAWAMQMLIMVLLLKGENALAESRSMQLLELSKRFGFKTRIATAWVQLGRASVSLGKVEAGMDFLRKGVDLWRSAGGKFHLAEYGAQAADALLRAGRPNEAQQFILDAQAVQSTTDERYYEAELQRLSGRVLELDGDVTAAERHYEDALHIAEIQGLKLLSLRAACDLGRLWRHQSKAAEALRVLRPLCAWFTEGSGFTDPREARALLESLQEGAVAT